MIDENNPAPIQEEDEETFKVVKKKHNKNVKDKVVDKQ